jgi:hypothetical protein
MHHIFETNFKNLGHTSNTELNYGSCQFFSVDGVSCNSWTTGFVSLDRYSNSCEDKGSVTLKFLLKFCAYIDLMCYEQNLNHDSMPKSGKCSKSIDLLLPGHFRLNQETFMYG